jgi:hypothetical protein
MQFVQQNARSLGIDRALASHMLNPQTIFFRVGPAFAAGPRIEPFTVGFDATR